MDSSQECTLRETARTHCFLVFIQVTIRRAALEHW